MSKKKKKTKSLKIKVKDSIRKGVYSNMVKITKTPKEAILDFLFIDSPEEGTLVSRIILSPEQAKALASLLEKINKKE